MIDTNRIVVDGAANSIFQLRLNNCPTEQRIRMAQGEIINAYLKDKFKIYTIKMSSGHTIVALVSP